MRSAIKFSLLGSIVGMVLMYVALLIIGLRLNKHPALDTQVIQHLESMDYPVDSLGSGRYAFFVNEDRFVFEYSPEDPTYFQIWAIFGLKGYSPEEVMLTCMSVMDAKKNCILLPAETNIGLTLYIFCESFLDAENALDTKIIDRSIQQLQAAITMVRHELDASDDR